MQEQQASAHQVIIAGFDHTGGMSALKEVVADGHKVLVHVYPLGGLGWTWTLHPDSGIPIRNHGPLAHSEAGALAQGAEAAVRYLESLRRRGPK